MKSQAMCSRALTLLAGMLAFSAIALAPELAVSETLRASGLKLRLEGQFDHEASNAPLIEAPVLVSLLFEDLDASLQVLRLDAGAAPESGVTKVDAAELLADWDSQFLEGGPLVKVEVHEQRTVSIGGNSVEVTYGKLRFQGRVGRFYGFTAAQLAAAKGDAVDWNQFAFFLLCEGPEPQDEALEALFSQALNGLKVVW
ncbi:MAG: hypothetical protein AUK47_13865 [Deltaproteobacteria bacterium CG2_30_63_29]|nr:MAG: hypothetical protein AUK47_13865 [Deltaproteobacteria bacterium CG2_30_63_29]PJB48637.1 MAG: hypothetical protein CO108_01880 [Deltaproteobacteria bacterium CG_4_9_14_3_um_filter_63_12]